jgi:hypothetical protein
MKAATTGTFRIAGTRPLSLRCNPSSGNLHPTETYARRQGVEGLADGLHHYVSRDHALTPRRRDVLAPNTPSRLGIGLSFVHWRGAWKYGERAFRFAAGAVGWRAEIVKTLSTAELVASFGLNRDEDFESVEPEDAESLVAIETSLDFAFREPPASTEWMGCANWLDAHPIYRWPIIDEVSCAIEGRASSDPEPGESPPPRRPAPPVRAAEVILGRRSAQRFGAKFTMGFKPFLTLLDSLAAARSPFDVWRFRPRLHPILWVHRVEGLEPGLYDLPRHPSAIEAPRKAMRDDFDWQAPEAVPAHIPLRRSIRTDALGVVRTLNCRQAIAGDGRIALTLIAEFEPLVSANPWRYWQLHWEAGLIGQALYLEAEAAGLRGTGIGCFFDDDIPAMLGVSTDRFQALYGFTIGRRPLVDERIMTLPAYPGRKES